MATRKKQGTPAPGETVVPATPPNQSVPVEQTSPVEAGKSKRGRKSRVDDPSTGTTPDTDAANAISRRKSAAVGSQASKRRGTAKEPVPAGATEQPVPEIAREEDYVRNPPPSRRGRSRRAPAPVPEELPPLSIPAEEPPRVSVEETQLARSIDTPPALERPAVIEAAHPSGVFVTDDDLYLFNEGTHRKLYQKFGAHLTTRDGVEGVYFAVWAPAARSVSVVGEFNGWRPGQHRLHSRGSSGVWDGFFPGLQKGQIYKFHIESQFRGYKVEKGDPFAILNEVPPKTASVIWDLEYDWNDSEWMRERAKRNALDAPISIYEMHLGSWRRDIGNEFRSYSYRDIAPILADYLVKMNFTHVELLPIMEHPYYGSWGYQSTGYFAASSRFGTPQDLKYLIEHLHQRGIGVILDWVPSHFATDEHGLAFFDGTHVFEHADPRQGFHPDWGSLVFNYGRNEVRSFLASSAFFWIEEFHADGLRVDAVASMLYLDYSRKHGEWIPNKFGGRENLEAVAFLRRLNEDIYSEHPDVQVIAEESTSWPLVSKPTYIGGLGFGMKWDMGWMHDTLEYMAHDPVHRRYHHSKLTFRQIYAYSENFVLPLSHDEVVHGKGSLIGKMPGDDWQKFANLRLLFGYMWAQSGKKLLFMGGEIGQWKEWNHDDSVDWSLVERPQHAGVQRWVEDLNRTYRETPPLFERDFDPSGFEWIDCNDSDQSVISFLRRGSDPEDEVVAVFNFTPVPRHNYEVGVSHGGYWKEILNSDAPIYGGSGQGNMGGLHTAPIPLHGRRCSLTMTLPPLGAVMFRRDRSVRPQLETLFEEDESGISSALKMTEMDS